MVFAWGERETHGTITGCCPQSLGCIRRLRHGRLKVEGGAIDFNVVDVRGILLTRAVVLDLDFVNCVGTNGVLPLCERARRFIRGIARNQLGAISREI